jgi:hypothetical protein
LNLTSGPFVVQQNCMFTVTRKTSGSTWTVHDVMVFGGEKSAATFSHTDCGVSSEPRCRLGVPKSLSCTSNPSQAFTHWPTGWMAWAFSAAGKPSRSMTPSLRRLRERTWPIDALP